MYILASTVSDDQVPDVTSQVQKFVSDFGGTEITETQLGKKKLAYPVKKTRNGYYVVLNFTMDTKKINEFDAKIHTQDSTIIRYIIVNQEEHYARLAKDIEVQAKMNANRPPQAIPAEEQTETTAAPAPKVEKIEKVEAPVMNAAELDKKIEEALTEDIIK